MIVQPSSGNNAIADEASFGNSYSLTTSASRARMLAQEREKQLRRRNKTTSNEGKKYFIAHF